MQHRIHKLKGSSTAFQRTQLRCSCPPARLRVQTHAQSSPGKSSGTHDCQQRSTALSVTQHCRRDILQLASGLFVASQLVVPSSAGADDFVTSSTGLKYLDVRRGEGVSPLPGDTVVVHWAGFTKGYQGKRIDNTSVRDEPYEFVLGAGQAIPAFEEAVSSMRAGGIRRVEVPGDKPELAYPRDRKLRFTDELIFPDLKIFKYRVGPQPVDLGGQRALDFVLDNPTLQDFNRTLLFDIKLLAVRKPLR